MYKKNLSRFLNGLLFVTMSLGVATGCRREIVREPYQPTSDHDAYRHGLVEAGLGQSALGRDWLTAAEQSLEEATFVTTPMRVARYVDRGAAFAIAYGLDVPRGRRLQIAVTFEGAQKTRVFVDLFRVRGETSDDWAHIASADPENLDLRFEPRWDGRYVVRVQPELLRGGRCEIVIRQVAALAFPVEGRNERAIGSRFGDPRDGGRRVHRGIDIFAPRHTPVLAPTDSFVHWVGENRLGGRCIWLYDDDNDRYYYLAHLESWIAEAKTWVKAGDPVGTVGNSGNARTTPPHLHFAVSMPGHSFVDPYPFVRPGDPEAKPISGSLETLGRWVRARADLNAPSRVGGEIPRNTPMQVFGAADDRYQVRLPTGVIGWVPIHQLEPVTEPIFSHALMAPTGLLDSPGIHATLRNQLTAGDTVEILGAWNELLFVRTSTSTLGWIQNPSIS